LAEPRACDTAAKDIAKTATNAASSGVRVLPTTTAAILECNLGPSELFICSSFDPQVITKVAPQDRSAA
jgi:hypothetical protein